MTLTLVPESPDTIPAPLFADQLVFQLKWKTPREWGAVPVAHFEEFLQDHASCERKAHANCMAIIIKFQNRTELVETMLEVAAEELEHLRQVVGLLHARGLTLGNDQKDPYVHGLLAQLRGPSLERLIDRLLVTSIIEARGCERFELIAESLADQGQLELADYYRELSRVEARHYGTYLRLARHYGAADEVEARFQELLAFEGQLAASLPWRASLH